MGEEQTRGNQNGDNAPSRGARHMQGILEGIRVLELGQVLAAPFAGAILADLGADVV